MRNHKLKYMLSAALFAAGQMSAFAAGDAVDIVSQVKDKIEVQSVAPIEPTYLKDALVGSPWSRNWFVSGSAGASAFIGSPLGCGDLFDRVQPTFQLTAGKWFTPAVGGRIAYQGYQFKDAAITKHGYHAVHADFLWNVIGMDRHHELGLHRWTLAPFIGVGAIHHEDNGKVPFTFNYGVMAAYRINKRLSVNMELSGLTTFKDFDGVGNFQRFGDNFCTATAGITINIGKVGWKRAVDAAPYRMQNEWLIERINDMMKNNLRQSAADSLLANGGKGNLNGEYSGLISLRARLANKGASNTNGLASTDGDSFYNEGMIADSLSGRIASSTDGTKLIGVPFYFFFNINTTDLTDPSQLQNLTNLSKVAKARNLIVYVDGAADAATGNEAINDSLSEARANYIAGLLVELGIAPDHIRIAARGGINKFSPVQRNRHTRVKISTE